MMITDREKFIHDLYEDLLRMPKQVLSIFINYFGEDRVDLQGFPSKQELLENIQDVHLCTWVPNEYISNSNLTPNQVKLWADNAHLNIFSLPNEVLDVWFPRIKERIVLTFFSEGSILIKFGEVRITNEHDKYIDIQGLWGKVGVNINGTSGSGFKLNRSEYSFLHLKNNYMHSHINSIPTQDFTKFQSPCLGDGPIRGTISSLIKEFDVLRWQLFCLELDNYIHTESLKGGPYHYLENLRENNSSESIYDFSMTNISRYTMERAFPPHIIKDFITYFIKQGELKFNYTNGSYGLGMSFLQYIILISNSFIKWYNIIYNELGEEGGMKSLNDLLYYGILYKSVVTDNVIYINNNLVSEYNTYASYQGAKICTFKGEDILLQLLDSTTNINNNSLILNKGIAEAILAQILKIINLKYGK